MKIILLPAFTFIGETTNSSSELFVLNTQWNILDILEWIEEEAGFLSSYAEFDVEGVKVLSGPEALLYLWDTIPEYVGHCYWVEEDDDYREMNARDIPFLRKFPPLTELMLQALGNLSRDTINEYNLATLPFSCPAYSLSNPEIAEAYSSCYEYLPENPDETHSRWDVYDNLLAQHIKNVRAQLVDWIQENKVGLDILMPNVVILPSADDNTVGYELWDPIATRFSGLHLHLG